jgi:hypothetical protein
MSSALLSSPTLSAPEARNSLAPDLVALFLGVRPHPDVVIPPPLVTVASLAAARRATAADPQSAIFEWDGPGQRLKG